MPAEIKITIVGVDQASGVADGVAGSIRKMGDAAGQGGGGFNALKEIAIGALREIGTVAVDVGMKVGAAVVDFAKDSVNAAGTFQSSVQGLSAVAGDSLAKAGFSLDDVSKKALQLGKDTAFSAQESIAAMTELAKGGVPIADVMGEATDATLALASASGEGLAQSAEIVAKQLGVWAETGVDATQVTDLLASAANASTVGVSDLALGLANAGGTAKTAGVSYQDLVQSMALIAPNFSSASDAGTSFKTFLSRMIPTTDSAKDAMIALGLATEDGKSKFFDAQGQFIGMHNAAALLQEATAGLSEEEKLLAFNTIFGSDAIRAAAAIANGGAEGFDAMGQAMADSGGAAQAAATMNQGYQFSLEQLSGSVETLQIMLGTALLPVLTQVVDFFTTGVNQVMTFAETFLKLVPEVQNATNPLQALAQVIGVSLSSVVPGAGAQIIALSGTFGQFWPVIQQGIGIVQNLASWFMANLPAALAIGGAALTTLWGLAQTAFNNIMAVVNAVMPSILALVQSVLAQMAAFWQAHGAEIMAFVQTTWATIQNIIAVALPLISGIIAGTLALIAGFIQDHGAQIQQILGYAWTAISSLIQGALALIQGILTAALAIMQGNWEGAWTAIQTMSVTVTQSLWNIIKAALDLIAMTFGTSVDQIVSMWTNNFSKIATVVGPYMQQAQDAITPVIDAIVGAFGSVVSAIEGAITAVGNFISAAAKMANISIPSIPGVPGKAVGGPVYGGQAYMVGEQGPELFVPDQPGNIVPNHSVSNYYNYSPTYGSAPMNPSQDFALMQTLAGV